MAGFVGSVARSGRALVCELSGLLAAAADLLGSASCAGCGRPAAGELCERCRRWLRDQHPVARWVRAAAGDAVPAVAAARYDSGVRELLIAYKERGRRGLRSELGEALFVAVLGVLAAPVPPGPTLAAGPGPPLLLVPVPSRPATLRARGHDAVRVLARQAAGRLRALGQPAAVRAALVHRRSVADQAGLDVLARYANLAGAMAVRRPAAVRGCPVVVVDDIVTTGATAAEAARALAAAGAHVLGVATVALTPRRGQPVSGARSEAAQRGLAG